MSDEQAEAAVHITKTGAATRLLESSIRLHLAGEDPLAAHVVASSAAQILCDIAKLRGYDDLDDAIGLTIYYLARDYLANRLPDWATERDLGAEFLEIVRNVAERMESGEISAPKDISVKTTNKALAYKQLKTAFNFLKHADRDAGTSLDLSKVNVSGTIYRAFRLFELIFPGTANSAILAFVAFEKWKDGEQPGGELIESIFNHVGDASEEDVRAFLLDFAGTSWKSGA